MPGNEDIYGDDEYEAGEGQLDGDETYEQDMTGGRNFDTLPAIVYRGKVLSWERKTASTGTVQFEVRFSIEAPSEHAGRLIFWRTNVGPKFDWTRTPYFRAVGYSGDKISWRPSDQIGVEVGILLGHRKGDTRIFEEVKEFMPVTDSRVPGHEEYEEDEPSDE